MSGTYDDGFNAGLRARDTEVAVLREQLARQAPAGVYVASKSNHAPMWQRLRAEGWPIVSTWIDEAGEGESVLTDLWRRCVAEASDAVAVVAYHETGEQWKGAFVEIGAALANGRPVFLVGRPPGSWFYHPLVRQCGSLPDAIDSVRALSVPAPPEASERVVHLSARDQEAIAEALLDDRQEHVSAVAKYAAINYGHVTSAAPPGATEVTG